jgi:hypothetical protein
MDDSPDVPLIDYDELKRELVNAIRAVIQEEADRLGISYEASRRRIFRQSAAYEKPAVARSRKPVGRLSDANSKRSQMSRGESGITRPDSASLPAGYV